MNSLRLGLVGPVPPPNGGMAMQTLQLQRLLESEGVTVHRLATNGPCRPAFLSGVPGLRALCRLAPYLAALWRLAGTVDVIHLMSNSGWSWQLHSAPALWIGWLRATPVVVNYRGGEAQRYFRRSFRWVRPSLKKATVIVVPTGFLQDVFRHYGESARTIPNIVDRDLFSPRTARSGSGFTLVVTRNLESIYGIDTAIRAFAQVLARDDSLRLRIAGSGPAEALLKALVARLGLSHAVTFEGRLDRAGMVALYKDADAMLNPSTVDNMPNSLLEALACGVPVISTNVGGIPFMVKHRLTALLVPPGDVDAMAESISELKSNAALRGALISNGLAEVEQYTWPRIRQQWLNLYVGLRDKMPLEAMP